MLPRLLEWFGGAGWEAHGHCFLWTSPLLELLVISNLFIAAAYFSIPAVLVFLTRERRDLVHRPVFILFAIFILGCGFTHLVKVWTIWEPVYRLQGWVDTITAGASVGTAILLWPLLPRVLTLPSPTQLRAVNAELEREIRGRKDIEATLQHINEELERRVAERTMQLALSNEALQREIEDRKQVEAALKATAEEADRERRRLNTVLEALPVGVWIANRDGELVQHNAAAERVWGGSVPPATQQSEYSAYRGWWADTGESLRAEDWGMAVALNTGEVVLDQLVDIERFDGSRGTILNSAAPIKDADGRVVGAVAAAMDVTAQQQAETALRQSEARLSGIIESAMDAIISVNEDQELVVFNQAAEQIFGVPEHEALGQSLNRFVPKHLRDAHTTHIERFGRTAVTKRSMSSPAGLIALRANGEEFPIEATISQVSVDGEKLFTVILRDVTHQRKAEQEREEAVAQLEMERTRLAAVLEQMPSGLSIAEAPSGKLVLHNRAAIEIIGHPLLESAGVVDYSQYGALHPTGDPYKPEEYPIARAVLGETIRQQEMIYRRGDGSLIVLSVSAAPLRDANGMIVAAISTFEDISAHKRAEQTQQMLAAIVENTEESIVAKSLDGRILSWNKGAERMYGYTADEAVGQSILVLFPADRAAEETSILERVRSGESIKEFETIRRRKDGSVINVSLTVSPIRDVTGRIVGASAVTRDITERVRQEQQRAELLLLEQEARQAAEEASALKSQFLAMISHELRTPLTSIMGFATTLQADDISFPQDVQSEFIDIISQESAKLKDLVDQLLDVSRLQAKTLRIQLKPQSLASIVSTADVQMQTVTANHKLRIDIPEDLPWVMADERRIGQVIVNLVDNAAKYSPAGTTIKIAAEKASDRIQISVKDQGVGIPLDQREIAFEAFRQLEDEWRARGAGLGLAICKGLVEAHGGIIWIADGDSDGRGTTVTFTLPTAEEANP